MGILFLGISLGKFGITAAYNDCYLTKAILFPTIFVSTAFGISNLLARIFTIMAPLIAGMDHPAPEIIFCIFVCIAGIGSIFLE